MVKVDVHWETGDHREVVERRDTGESVAEVGLDVDTARGAIAQGQAVAGEQVEHGHLQGAVDEQNLSQITEQV